MRLLGYKVLSAGKFGDAEVPNKVGEVTGSEVAEDDRVGPKVAPGFQEELAVRVFVSPAKSSSGRTRNAAFSRPFRK